MEVKTIRNVDTETWSEFKSLAARSNVSLGSLLKTLVEQHRKNNTQVWNKILSGERILSEKDATALESICSSMRKERGFRI